MLVIFWTCVQSHCSWHMPFIAGIRCFEMTHFGLMAHSYVHHTMKGYMYLPLSHFQGYFSGAFRSQVKETMDENCGFCGHIKKKVCLYTVTGRWTKSESELCCFLGAVGAGHFLKSYQKFLSHGDVWKCWSCQKGMKFPLQINHCWKKFRVPKCLRCIQIHSCCDLGTTAPPHQDAIVTTRIIPFLGSGILMNSHLWRLHPGWEVFPKLRPNIIFRLQKFVPRNTTYTFFGNVRRHRLRTDQNIGDGPRVWRRQIMPTLGSLRPIHAWPTMLYL